MECPIRDLKEIPGSKNRLQPRRRVEAGRGVTGLLYRRETATVDLMIGGEKKSCRDL